MKRPSKQVLMWRAQKSFPDDWIVTSIRENQKRGKARDRFALYREGMTVRQYKEVFVATKIAPRWRAAADLRWDHVAGFIHVTAPKEKE